MEYERLRKILHLFGIIALGYYIFPCNMRQYALLLTFAAIMLVEIFRIFFHMDIPLLRHYEKNSMSGFGWCAISLSISLLIFPPQVVVPVVFGWAWVDPFMGIFRGKRLMPYVSFLLYIIIFMLSFALVPGVRITVPLSFIAVIVSVTAVLSEMLGKVRRFIYLNDDFTMVVIPATVFYVLYYFIYIPTP